MQASDLTYIIDTIYKRSGIKLTEDKAYLVENRLLPIARSKGFTDIGGLCTELKKGANDALLIEVTEAMTTNESSFFRDNKPFELMKQHVFPRIIEGNKDKKLRIWSAACSNGQEPCSVSITIKEGTDFTGWNTEFVATDLAKKVVDKARKGIYTQFEAQRGLPIQILLKYFTQVEGTNWQVKDEILKMISYRTKNLMDTYAELGQFDMVLCRNVLIYFDEETKGEITRKMSRALKPHGVLILGATETLIDPDKMFEALPDFRGAYTLKA